MNSHGPTSGIHCPIGLYGKHEPEIAGLTAIINRSSSARERSRAAQDLNRIVGLLRDCGEYDEGNLNCRMCREAVVLREKTVSVAQQTDR